MVAKDNENTNFNKGTEEGIHYMDVDDFLAHGGSNADINDVYIPDFANNEDLANQ